MKNLVLLLSFFLLGQFVSAQNNVIDLYFKVEQKDPQFSKLKVNSKTFEYASEFKSADAREQKLIASIQKLEGIKGLFIEQSEKAKMTYENAYDKIRANKNYEELMSFQHKEDQGIFMIRESEDKIQELMAMFNAENEFGVITIFGEIELQSITDLAAVMEKNGKAWFDHFENMSEDAIVFDLAAKPGDQVSTPQVLSAKDLNIRIYPNPAVDHVMLEALEDKGEKYEIAFYSLLGEKLEDLGKLNLPYRLELNDFPKGTYFVRITNASGKFKNYKIVKP